MLKNVYILLHYFCTTSACKVAEVLRNVVEVNAQGFGGYAQYCGGYAQDCGVYALGCGGYAQDWGVYAQDCGAER